MNKESILLTVDELCQLLKVSSNTVYYWASRSEIPHIKVGKHLRFNQNEVLAYFANKTRSANHKSACLPPGPLLGSNASSWSLKTRNAGLAYSGSQAKPAAGKE